MASLDDVLLGLLYSQPGSAYDLQNRVTEVLGPLLPTSYAGVTKAAGRLDRQGYARMIAAPARSGPNRLPYAITEAGRERRRHWFADLDPRTPGEEVLIRCLLAIDAEDQAALVRFVDDALAAATARCELLRPAPRGPGTALQPAEVRNLHAYETAAATVAFLWQVRREAQGTPRTRARRSAVNR